jgi:hypothetical protein
VDADSFAVEVNLLALDPEIRNAQIDAGARLEDDAIDESTQHKIDE